jgi:2-dehydro-3-deoxyphosphogluconate aldolase/(4S)-4-hydroxy-2-oxoglutarate aldolase
MIKTEEAVAQIGQTGLVFIIRGQYTAVTVQKMAETLLTTGCPVMEVTLNTPAALNIISHLRQQLGNAALVGAGTVRTSAQWLDAFNAGAQFTVAPNLDLATMETAVAHNILHLPGVFTPTEAETAHAADCQLLKLFPASFGGPGYLKAISAPLDDLKFVPTGGITHKEAAAYRQVGAFALGVGAVKIDPAASSLDDLKTQAQQLRQAWEAGG